MEASVDAATAVNEVNNDDASGYFCTVINNIICPLDYTDHDGSVQKCISVAKHVMGSTGVACTGIVRSSITDHRSPILIQFQKMKSFLIVGVGKQTAYV